MEQVKRKTHPRSDSVSTAPAGRECDAVDRGQSQTDALPRPHALDSAAAAGLSRATPHALPR